MRKYNEYIPTYCVKTIYEVDFNKLYALGKRIILTDLDNTLISYRFSEADEKLQIFNRQLREIGFKIYIVSNNNEKRIDIFSQHFCIDGFLIKAGKPKPNKVDSFIKINQFNKNEIIFIGDQLVTDIACANNAMLDSIFVKTIDISSQKWYTKINRLREKKIVKYIKKNDYLVGNMIESVIGKSECNE